MQHAERGQGATHRRVKAAPLPALARVIRALLSLSARAQVHRTRAMTVDARAHAAAASERALAGTRLCSRDLAHSMHSASDASAFIRRRRRESGEVFFWGEVKEGRRRGEV